MPGPKNTSAASINRLANELPCARQLFKALNEDDGKLKAQECMRAGSTMRHSSSIFLMGRNALPRSSGGLISRLAFFAGKSINLG
jgi:hypothetical protein